MKSESAQFEARLGSGPQEDTISNRGDSITYLMAVV